MSTGAVGPIIINTEEKTFETLLWTLYSKKWGSYTEYQKFLENYKAKQPRIDKPT